MSGEVLGGRDRIERRLGARGPSLESAGTRSLAWIALAATALVARPASAGDDRAAAEALYDSARTLVDHGDYEHACPKFEASLKLVAAASTMINIARCSAGTCIVRKQNKGWPCRDNNDCDVGGCNVVTHFCT